MSEYNNALLPYSLLRFYATANYACSYLPEQMARSHVVAPSHLITPEIYSALVVKGFRRSGMFTYRPGCDHCKACISVRLSTTLFTPNRSQRRIIKQHSLLKVSELPLEFQQKHYDLYCRYQKTRHAGGSMEPSPHEGESQYNQFLLQSQVDTRLFEFSENGTIKMVSIVDRLSDGISAVYTFYDPDDQHASYGTYAILWQIGYCRQQALNWLYLGYWIKNCRKMSYKTHFRPIEGLVNGRWRELTDQDISLGLP